MGPASPERRQWLRLAVLIFAAALTLRSAPLLFHRLESSRIATADSVRYLELAARLVAGEGFSRLDPVTGEASPELFRTPGYPVFLALVSGLPGSRNAWVLAFQILADALAAVLCFALVTAWASRRAGALAATLFVIDPAHIVYSNLLMADVACGAAVAAGLFLLELAARRQRTPIVLGLLAAAGGCLTAATALRPVVAFLWLPAAIYLHRRGIGRRGVACFVAAAVLFPLGWTARNGLAAGTWTLSTAFDLNLAMVAAASVEARSLGLSRSAGEKRVMTRAKRLAQDSELSFHRACRSVAVDIFVRSPGTALIEAAASTAEMMLAGERRYLLHILRLPASEGRQTGSLWRDLAGYRRFERVLVIGQALAMAAIWALAAAGAVTLCRGGNPQVALLALFSLAVVLGPSLVVATGRLRLPVAFIIHGLAGVGAEAAARRLGAHRSE